MASAPRPKPSYPASRPPYSAFLDWLDRQFTDALGTQYKTLAEAIAGAVAGIDLSAIEAELADHETRIDALESAGPISVQHWLSKVVDIGSSASTSYYYPLFGFTITPSVLSTQRAMRMPVDGTFGDFHYKNVQSAGTANAYSWCFQVNGVDSALKFTGITPSDVTLHSDTSTTVSVVAGDLVGFRQQNGAGAFGSPTYATWSIKFVPS